MTTQEALHKYKTVAGVLEAKDVPLALKLSAVLYEHSKDGLEEGCKALAACAELTYSVAWAMCSCDREKAIALVSEAINITSREFNNRNL